MPPRVVTEKLLVWGSDMDEVTIEQAKVAARSLPILAGHIALMPDAHIGIGATIGSVIATEEALIPSAVGVDVGCGVVASETMLHLEQLPDDLAAFLRRIERVVPAGVGEGHRQIPRDARAWLEQHPHPDGLSDKQRDRTLRQFGTLGSGNHFLELCADEREIVWLMLHSGSRGIGNELATGHIRSAKELARMEGLDLEDPDLAWLQQGTPAFERYLADLLWAQDYARANRDRMLDAALRELSLLVPGAREVQRINNHHNYAVLEEHGGRRVWVTRKGAIRARAGDFGVVPGSMGTGSFIVRGKGSEASWDSCAHGAGRRMSRGQARRELSVEDFRRSMEGRAWQANRAERLIDEAPGAYKDLTAVMRDQQDLVEVVHHLDTLLNYKGT